MKTSPLRQRMLDAMQMRGYSPRTHTSYVQAVLDLSHYYHRSPDKISAEEVQQWLLWLLKERHVSSSTRHLYFNRVRFLFVTVLEDANCAVGNAGKRWHFTMPAATAIARVASSKPVNSGNSVNSPMLYLHRTSIGCSPCRMS